MQDQWVVGILVEVGCVDDVEQEQVVVQWAAVWVTVWWYVWVCNVGWV